MKSGSDNCAQILNNSAPVGCIIETEFWEANEDQKIPLRDQALKHHNLGRKVGLSAVNSLLNSQYTSIEKRTDGLPNWPAGCTGSISHTQGAAIAIVGMNQNWNGLGIDIETRFSPYDPLDIKNLVMNESEEILMGSAFPMLSLPDHILALFCIKESVYKAAFPKLRQAWEFSDVQLIQIDSAGFICLPENLLGSNNVTMPDSTNQTFAGKLLIFKKHIVAISTFPKYFDI